jgi:hypothetical protein
MVEELNIGGAPPRVAVLSMAGPLRHEPPRTILYRPVAGPGGLRSGIIT